MSLDNSIERSADRRAADQLAAVFAAAPDGLAVKTQAELRLDLLRWLLDLPPEIDPAHAAQILIGRQARGESAVFSDPVQAMLAELGALDRGRLAAIPRNRRRVAAGRN